MQALLYEASPKQMAFIDRLVSDREVPEDLKERALAVRGSREASGMIDQLLRCPERPREDAVSEPGVYRSEDGRPMVVKWNREHSRLYAMAVVPATGHRLMENGQVQELELEYAPGAVRSLKASSKLSLEEGAALTARYGRCICCGARLKAADSVSRGIGPVCRKYYR